MAILGAACALFTATTSCRAEDAEKRDDPNVVALLSHFSSGGIITTDSEGFVDSVLVFSAEKCLPHLKGLTRLKTLRIADGTKANWTHLRGLTSLETLAIIPLKTDVHIGISDTDLVNLKDMTRLKMLGMMNTEITDAGLQHLRPLRNLESLTLMHCRVTDAGLDTIKKLPKLKILGLQHTQVTNVAVAELQKSRPNLKIGFVPDDPDDAETER